MRLAERRNFNRILLIEKGFCKLALTRASWRAKRQSKLPKTTIMPNRWAVMSFTKSHERLLLRQLADRKIRIFIMLLWYAQILIEK